MSPPVVVAGGEGSELSALERPHRPAAEERLERFDPVGNERLTAVVGIVLLVLTVVELATILLGVHRFMSLHVFVGFVLIPPIVLKLASTGWRFARYYTGTSAYVVQGPPLLPMRLLAPILVAATIVLFASGVAMGILHGNALAVARQLHGPSSVVWLALVGVHALVYLKRALTSSAEDAAALVRAVRGARARAYLLTTAIISGVVLGIATVPAQHHWVNLPRGHHHRSAIAVTEVSWSSSVCSWFRRIATPDERASVGSYVGTGWATFCAYAGRPVPVTTNFATSFS